MEMRFTGASFEGFAGRLIREAERHHPPRADTRAPLTLNARGSARDSLRLCREGGGRARLEDVSRGIDRAREDSPRARSVVDARTRGREREREREDRCRDDRRKAFRLKEPTRSKSLTDARVRDYRRATFCGPTTNDGEFSYFRETAAAKREREREERRRRRISNFASRGAERVLAALKLAALLIRIGVQPGQTILRTNPAVTHAAASAIYYTRLTHDGVCPNGGKKCVDHAT